MKYYRVDDIYYCVSPDSTYWCFTVSIDSPSPHCTFWPRRAVSNFEKDTQPAPGFEVNCVPLTYAEFDYYRAIFLKMMDLA